MIPLYYNVRSLTARRVATAATSSGLALVTFVFASVLMLTNGIESALRSGGRTDNVMLLREGATSEIVSVVDRDASRALQTYAEIASGPSGQPLVASEIVVLVALPRGQGAFVNATTRGVVGESWLLRPAVEIVEGRAPRPGTYEVAIGSGLVGASPGAFVGGELGFAGTRWPVVGRMAARGAGYESEVWADRDRLGRAFDRIGFSTITVRLRSPDDFDALAARVASDGRLSLKTVREDAYWAEQASGMATFLRVLGLFVSLVFGAGATIGAMVTMYGQVAARTRELAMMRAIGFRRRSVLASVVLESALLGAGGGIVGALGALLMRWVRIRTLNFQTFSEVRFGFQPTPGILVASVLFGTAMGFFGGLLPAVRAARVPILEATRT